MKNVAIKDFTVGEGEPLCFFLGPCALESKELAFEVAHCIKEISQKKNCNIIFKSSFDKANRSSFASKRGLGMAAGLQVLADIKDAFGFPIVTDIHLPEQAKPVAEVCDVLQIPAFLCRQTDLITAAANTGRVIKVKKGQFVAPWDMAQAVSKIQMCGNDQIILTERGTMFGYNNLVSDMRSIPIMQSLGVPVCFDASHSVQLPGAKGTESGGERIYIKSLAKAAIAIGANSLFIECHPCPDQAISDKASQLPLEELPAFLDEVIALYTLTQSFSNVGTQG